MQNQLDKQENSLQSIQALFPVPDMGTTLLDLVQDLQSELREAKELVEFLQAEKSMEEETAATANCDVCVNIINYIIIIELVFVCVP